MTVQALKFFHKLKDFAPAPDKRHFDVVEQALEEVEQYRALGTVEELKEAREKQIPKKPIVESREYGCRYYCPICDWSVDDDGMGYKQPYCMNCGQKVDWEEGGTSD